MAEEFKELLLSGKLSKEHLIKILKDNEGIVNTKYRFINDNDAFSSSGSEYISLEVSSRTVDNIDLTQYFGTIKKYIYKTPLTLAIENKLSIEVIEELLKHGANVNFKTVYTNKYYSTPILLNSLKEWSGVTQYNLDVLNLLIKYGANIHVKNELKWNLVQMTLHIPPFNSNTLKNPDIVYRIIEILIKNGINLNERNAQGFTPLLYATEVNIPLNIIELMIDNGANINITNKIDKMTPLMYLSISDTINKYTIPKMELFINKGAKVNQQDKNGKTVLNHCIHFELLYTAKEVNERIKCLLDNGAKINMNDIKGQSIVYNAFNRQSDKFINQINTYLIGNVDEIDDNTILGPALIFSYPDKILNLLISKGLAQITKKDKRALTPNQINKYKKLVYPKIKSLYKELMEINDKNSASSGNIKDNEKKTIKKNLEKTKNGQLIFNNDDVVKKVVSIRFGITETDLEEILKQKQY